MKKERKIIVTIYAKQYNLLNGAKLRAEQSPTIRELFKRAKLFKKKATRKKARRSDKVTIIDKYKIVHMYILTDIRRFTK